MYILVIPGIACHFPRAARGLFWTPGRSALTGSSNRIALIRSELQESALADLQRTVSRGSAASQASSVEGTSRGRRNRFEYPHAITNRHAARATAHGLGFAGAGAAPGVLPITTPLPCAHACGFCLCPPARASPIRRPARALPELRMAHAWVRHARHLTPLQRRDIQWARPASGLRAGRAAGAA